MKKHNKKVQAKLDLLKLAEAHAFLEEPKKLAKLLKTIGDEDLEFVVETFVAAKQTLVDYLDKIKEDVESFSSDDSDF